MEYIY